MKIFLFLTAFMCFGAAATFASPVYVSPTLSKIDTGGITTTVCTAPYVSVLPALSGTTITVRWLVDVLPSAYQIQYRLASDTLWSDTIRVTVARRDSNFTILKNLTACTKYEVRVRKVCSSTQFSNWTKYAFVSGNCPPPCYLPYNLAVSNNDTSASVKWATYNTKDSIFLVQWKKNGDTVWQSSTVKNSKAFSLTGLQPCTVYNIRVKTICSVTTSSDFSSKEFKTTGCISSCPAPSQLFYTASSAKPSISWTPTSANKYELQYRIAPDTNWVDTVILTRNYFNFPATTTCDKYQVRVRSLCSSTDRTIYAPASAWSNVLNFTTQGCTALCASPSRMNVSTTTTSAYISWDSTQGSNVKIYSLDWTTLADTSKHTIVSNLTKISYILNNLTPGTVYHIRVRVQCPNGNQGVWSPFLSFKTTNTNICFKPLQYNVQTQDTTAAFTWINVGGASKIVLWIVSTDSVYNKTFTLTGNSYTVALPSCKHYTARFKTQCNDTLSSDYTTAINFQTGNCPLPCRKIFEVTPLKTDSSTATITWAASTAPKYYVEYAVATANTDLPITQWQRDSSTTNNIVLKKLTSCQGYYVRVFAVCASGLSDPSNVIFFRMNCPVSSCIKPSNLQVVSSDSSSATISWSGATIGKFYVDYRIIDSTSGSTTTPTSDIIRDSSITSSITLKNLTRCKYYEVRVYAICANNILSDAGIIHLLTRGCISVNVSKAGCNAPENIQSLVIQDTSVNISWSTVAGASRYEVQLILPGISTFAPKSFIAAQPKIVISGLKICTSYGVMVRAMCDTTTGKFSAVNKFATGRCSASTCATPTNLAVTLTDTVAALTWNVVMDSVSTYSIRIRSTVGDTSWIAFSSTVPSFTVSGLVRCQTYQWQVRKICSTVPGDWSVVNIFTTKAGCGAAANNVSALVAENIIMQDFSVVPNPVSDYIEVGYTLKRTAVLSIEIFNWQGQLVNRRNLGTQDPAYYVQKYDDVSDLPTGLYLININAGGRVLTSQKWLKIE